MSDSPFYAPDHTPTPKPSTPGERLWTVVKGTHVAVAELRPREWGVELQILVDGDLRRGQLHPNREFALIEAGIRRETLIVRGWTHAQ